jgi:hypothetical protein
MFVGNREQYFSRLTMKQAGVELGTATQGYFQGVGIITVSIPNQENEIFFLYPAFTAQLQLVLSYQVQASKM